MSDKKLGLEPAFSHACANDQSHSIELGISKRFYAACAAMQGILASGFYSLNNKDSAKYISYDAYKIADSLLKREDE